MSLFRTDCSAVAAQLVHPDRFYLLSRSLVKYSPCVSKELSIYIRLACLLWLCLANSTAFGQSNIVLNGSFEINDYEWWGVSGIGMEVGKQSAQGTNHLIIYSSVYQDLQTTPGRNYVLKFATKVAVPRVYWGGQELTDFTFVPGTNFQWHYLFYSHVTALQSQTRLEFDDQSGATYLDDVSVGWLEEPVQILQQPSSAGGLEGSSATFTVAAFGGPPIFYQWYHDGAAIPNQTNFFLQLNDLKNKDAGAYLVVVSNVANTITSSNASLTVDAAPKSPIIILQPESQTISAGYAFSIRVAALGALPLRYQWSANGTNIPNATNASLGFSSVSNTDAGIYVVTVENQIGSVISLPATLTVTNAIGGGILLFDNRTLNAPVYDVDGVTKLAGSNYLAQMYAGPSSAILRPLAQPKPFRTGVLAGFINSSFYEFPDVLPQAVAYIQLRAWEAAWGNSYEEARARGGKFGFSPIISVTTIAPPGSPSSVATPPFSLRSGNALFTTGRLERGVRLPSGEYQWNVIGNAGFRYLVEKRMPPNNWFPLFTLTNITGTVTFTDPGNASAAFYRARILD